MKCVKIVSIKPHSFPVAACGGVVVQPGDELVVKSSIGVRVAQGLKGYLALQGDEYDEPKGLKGGHYELRKKKPDAPVKAVATDKAVKGKDLVKNKTLAKGD